MCEGILCELNINCLIMGAFEYNREKIIQTLAFSRREKPNLSFILHLQLSAVELSTLGCLINEFPMANSYWFFKTSIHNSSLKFSSTSADRISHSRLFHSCSWNSLTLIDHIGCRMGNPRWFSRPSLYCRTSNTQLPFPQTSLSSSIKWDDGICLLESLCSLTETKRTLLIDILVNETFCSIQAQNQHWFLRAEVMCKDCIL